MSEGARPDIVAQFRNAIQQARYRDASRLLETGEIAQMPDKRGALALIEWARRLVLGQRAMDAAQYVHLSPPRYGAESAGQLHTWELEG